MDAAIRLEGVAKTFTMHLRGGAELPVVRGVAFAVAPGECVALGGPSGAGKSSILKMIYGNYRADAGAIWLRDGSEWVDVARADPRRLLALRRRTLGYVSQFLRAIPRVPARELVAAAARDAGLEADAAMTRAEGLLDRLNVPGRLWSLPPATFSGGEQQRVNLARGLAAEHPILLLDEPTASLDAESRDRAVALIRERRDAGAAILGIFHDAQVRDTIADRVVDVTRFSAQAQTA
ncbi:phosphonate C-P lyase system protein PhnL [Dichotomicrobium thermohalophilum]|uniref:Alpha-D-ribose 1-methylphosphonate 5-triphosphate synthase subunit PhnL n=1 Tax=Dichotomicrobium thermohalophilum TaxID=933063 RepID=A0A397Q291_9HYPH|nr:phosphonate C-P lyase system protein PhnL [Dichotomicrobium thermohalophilum]RIA55610.1 alpha-D-ribose 1-methylphosphonate 5-triphosphate synthase subunit PhnL [Dichotomicrobium thermohalophilum]